MFFKTFTNREILSATFSKLDRTALAVQLWVHHQNKILMTVGLRGKNVLEQKYYDRLRFYLNKRFTGETGSLLSTVTDP